MGTESRTETIRVFLISSLRLPRQAFRALIEARSGFAVTGEADSCSEAAKSIHGSPTIILIDLPDSDLDPLRDLRALLTVADQSRSIVMTIPLDSGTRTEAVRLGAMGLVAKSESPDVLFTAMETVARQHVAWIDRSTMTEVLRTMPHSDDQSKGASDNDARLATLTKRERDIVNATVMGLKNRQVADRLFISETTVRHHLTSIFTKLGVHDRYELLRFAYQNGLAAEAIKRSSRSPRS